MRAVLGIDAAWTEQNPSGVALVVEKSARWHCVAVAPSYDAFLRYTADSSSSLNHLQPRRDFPAGLLIAASKRLLGGDFVTLVTVDIPVAKLAITGRRVADNCISKAFGASKCSAHSPNKDRPGKFSAKLKASFEKLGFPLATKTTTLGAPRRLVEVFPHPALLKLLHVEERVPYKVSKSRTYWPKGSLEERKGNLQRQLNKVLEGLKAKIVCIPLELPSQVSTIRSLKPYEDMLDALVCAWVGTKYLARDVTPYGDETAAIWVPN